MRATSAREGPNWEKLLIDAVNEPGTLSCAYQQFWNYSVGNQLLAWFECLIRGLKPGPINTFGGWLKVGRYVKKGEKAITLCMPVTVKGKSKVSASATKSRLTAANDETKEETRTVFVYRPRWFVLSQTEGDPYVPTELPTWSESRALKTLSIARIDFEHPNGNCQGLARQRQVAISPIAASPHSTLFHEVAHVVLGHTAEGPLEDQRDRTPRSLREVEAECVALICCESLSLPGDSDCRGYIQYWLRGGKIPQGSIQKIFKAADAILKAGYSKLLANPDSD